MWISSSFWLEIYLQIKLRWTFIYIPSSGRIHQWSCVGKQFPTREVFNNRFDFFSYRAFQFISSRATLPLWIQFALFSSFLSRYLEVDIILDHSSFSQVFSAIKFSCKYCFVSIPQTLMCAFSVFQFKILQFTFVFSFHLDVCSFPNFLRFSRSSSYGFLISFHVGRWYIWYVTWIL